MTEAPHSLKGRLRAAQKREHDLRVKLDAQKVKNREQQGTIYALNLQVRKLTRPVGANLPALVRAHRRAVEDGVGNWGETEAALFRAVK